VRFPRRARFRDVIRRQLDLFEGENRDLMRAVAEAEQAYNGAGADESEEAWGEYIDLVEQAEEELLALRDRYAETMAARERLRYEREFTWAAEKRLPSLVSRRIYERAVNPDGEL
jgi:hypothetical protein